MHNNLFRRPVLANGEQYVSPVEMTPGFHESEFPRDYDHARDNVINELDNALREFQELPSPKRFPDELTLCLRLHPDFIAKSFDPQAIFSEVPDLSNIGSRNYHVSPAAVAQTSRIKGIAEKIKTEISGRMVFVRGREDGFRRLIDALNRPESTHSVVFCREIRCIEKFDMLRDSEQLAAFNKEWTTWKEGRVEIVLHPSQHTEAEHIGFLEDLFRGHHKSRADFRVAHYEDGPLFVSCYLTRDSLNAIAGANPLRTAHPLVFARLEDLRSAPMLSAPLPPDSTTRSTIKVGMFDGGIDPSHPLLSGHAEQDEGLSIKTIATSDYIDHGTAVAGAILYGPLNGYNVGKPLPRPPVSVVSIRALPTSDLNNPDLYEAIDIIEAAVSSRKDIKVFNISFGPRGPILDDTISRFTFALDSLAVTHKVTFCVAVGNDGDSGNDMNRIQVPSDLVNGFGVGAYSEHNSEIFHAPYSCRGPGRECAKLKPDVVAFGGCDQTPIHLVATIPGKKVLQKGTSFSAPIVSALCAQATEGFDRGTTLLARALLIHKAKHPKGRPDVLLGHGIVAKDLEELLHCEDKEVIVIFQGDIAPKKSVRLPVMLPPGLVSHGIVSVRWTVAALPPVTPNHPTDYTTICIEDTFYPNDQIYTYKPGRDLTQESSIKLHSINDSIKINELVANGWTKSSLPVPVSGNQYPTEKERRLKYKWEPIVCRVKTMRASSLNNPFLALHAIPRHGEISRLEYAAVVTISAPSFPGDLYGSVVSNFSALQPVRIRTENEIRISI